MARSRVEKRPQVLRDLVAIAVYLADQSGTDDLAFRFLESAEANFERLATMPNLGVSRDYRDPRLHGVRMWRIAGFEDYLIFYRPTDSGVEIIRVIHGKRDIEHLIRRRD